MKFRYNEPLEVGSWVDFRDDAGNWIRGRVTFIDLFKSGPGAGKPAIYTLEFKFTDSVFSEPHEKMPEEQ
jgi:hypothetical protein